ncbi:MAG: hypothetical protein JSU95_11745 [Betaproteobacteria bacterium]|nr:MAG: hypothetical protein JSU95_11745 [Betaproteobacteria bacterium]
MTFRPLLLIVVLAALPLDHTVLAQDETLGRLFYTAGQRAALDANVRSSSQAVEKPISIPPSVTLNGVVTRSDGEQTVWIEGRAYHRTETDDLEVITRSAEPGTAEIRVRGVPKRRSVRVGQRLDPVTGETFEAFEKPPPETQLRRPANADSQGAEPASSEVNE